MPKKYRKIKRPKVPVAAAAAADSDPTKLGTSADDPGKNSSTSNPNVESGLDWETCTEEEQLKIIIRKKLEHLYDEALSTLVYKGFDQDVALKGLLERGYCVGESDCLTNVVENSLEFLTGKEGVVESEQDRRTQPFKNLESLVDFNLCFMLYILQKYRPNLNKMSICRCILMTNLNLNRAIIMNINDMPFDITEMPIDLNLEDIVDDDDVDNREKDGFLDLEINEMLDNMNILDDSVSEDMNDAMMAGLKKTQVEERIRWASKKVAQARRNQPCTIMSLREEVQLLQYLTESFLAKRESELLSLSNGLVNAEKSKNRLEMEKEVIEAEISASKLLESEAREKCLQVSKKGVGLRMKKEDLMEEIELEKKKTSELEKQLVETLAALIKAEMKLEEAIEEKKVAVAQVYLECQLALDSWRGKVEAIKKLTNEERDILREPVERLRKLLIDALTKVSLEIQALRD